MDASTHDRNTRSRSVPLGILDLGVFAGTFLFRWLIVEFPNDHFQHLSRARQVLLGDAPIRDFFDAGFFLQNYLSAAFQIAFGYNLFGEAILTIAFVAFGTMLVFHLAARFSGSRWIAACAALLMVVANPRLYSYPKVFLYVSAIGLVWLYARRGSRLHVCLMAALTVLAFLLRHDHGVYIAVMMVCFLGLREWGGALLWRRLGLYTGVTVGLLLPFLIFVQVTTGLVSYAVGSGPQANTISSSLQAFLIVPAPFKIDRSAPIWMVAPPIGPVNVRWAAGADDTVRQELERRYGLTAGVRQGAEDRIWSYVLTDERSGNVRALVLDSLVEDTGGIDRETFQVLPERWGSFLKRKLFVLRLRDPLPGVFNSQNALAWYYWLTLLVPVIALGWIGADWWRGRVARPEAAVVAAAAILCGIISHTLVRDYPSERLADVAAPTFVLAAWLARRIADPDRSLVLGRLTRTGIVSLVLVTFWSVWTVGESGSRLARAGVLDGPTGVWEQLVVVNRRLLQRPIDGWAPPGSTGRQALTRYVMDCTEPSDQILVTWYAPDVFFHAERGFAGGQAFLHEGWHASFADQRLTLERMQRQSVPIILSRPGDLSRSRFPLIYDYVQSSYRIAAKSSFGEEAGSFLVFVDARLAPVAEHRGYGLPCFRELVDETRGFDFGPVIHIRWVEHLGDAQRTAIEQSLGLISAEHSSGTTWRYRAHDISPNWFDTILAHDMVTDTYGFDREADERFGPIIHVRWIETLEETQRTAIERSIGLYRAEHTEGTTWRYRVPDSSPQRLRAIVNHDMVADTNGFDRGSLELDAPGRRGRAARGPAAGLQRWLAPARVRRHGAGIEMALDPTDRHALVPEPECRRSVLPRLRRPAGRLCRRTSDSDGQHRRPSAGIICSNR